MPSYPASPSDADSRWRRLGRFDEHTHDLDNQESQSPNQFQVCAMMRTSQRGRNFESSPEMQARKSIQFALGKKATRLTFYVDLDTPANGDPIPGQNEMFKDVAWSGRNGVTFAWREDRISRVGMSSQFGPTARITIGPTPAETATSNLRG